MWKRIETYIERNRDELDIDTPSPMLWQRIERELEPTPTLWERWSPLLKVAAAIVFAFGMAFWWLQDHSLPTSGIADMTQLTYSADWHKQDRQYDREVQYLLDSLQSYDPNLFPSMDLAMEEIKPLDEQLERLHLQLEEEGSDQGAVEELSQTYQAKIQILRKLLNQLRTSNP